MPSVVILLAVYDGECFLEEQIESLAKQTVDTLHIIASDDGSSDRSLEILEKAQQSWTKGEFRILRGPQQGFSRNFRFLLSAKIDADYYAFSDQDDIWDNDKLKKALEWGARLDPNQPHVHGNRERIVNEKGQFLSYSKLFLNTPGFGNALVQNVAAGHTLVFNRAARDLMVLTAQQVGAISHDYWIYIIVTGVGGTYHYSPTPCVSYRQHAKNVTGAKFSWLERIERIKGVLSGEVRVQSEYNIAALEEHRELLTPGARSILDSLKIIHTSNSMFTRVRALYHSGIYRQTWSGKISMYFLCLFRLL